MAALRILLITMVVGLATYTVVVIANYGTNFLPAYFADIAGIDWTGQFVLDFSLLLMLAILWILWRNRFSATGVVLALLAIPFVSMLLGSYLLYLIWKERGDVSRILLGDRAGSGAQ